MKMIWILSIAIIPFFSNSQTHDPHYDHAPKDKLYIEWFGENETANAFVESGMWHLMNAENEKAITFFEEALDKDPALFAPHVALAWLTWGETRDMHVQAAKKNVEGKNEVSQLFVSLLDLDNPKEGDAYPVWKKMHEISDGKFIHFYYARSIPDHQACIDELENLLKLSLDGKDSWNAHIYNALGYFYYRDHNMEKAKANFEKYMEAYPEGYNPYDSMAEFYLNRGDKERAVEYFTKSVEHFPGAVNGIQMLDKIELETAEH